MVGPALHFYLSQSPANWQPASLHPCRKQHHLPLVTSCTYFQKHFSFFPFNLLLGFVSRSCRCSAQQAMLEHHVLFWFPESLIFWRDVISWHPQATSCFPFYFLAYALSLHSCSPLLAPLLFLPHFSIDPFFSSPSSLELFASLFLLPAPSHWGFLARCITYCAEGKQCIRIHVALYKKSNAIYTYSNSNT